jgi:hypothetical protein
MDDRVALDRRIRKLEATLEALAARERVIAASGGLLSTGVVYVTAAGTLTTEADFAYIEGDNELRTGRARLAEQATPTTPASGFSLLFAGSSGVNNGVASSVDDAGVVYQMVRYATGTFTPTYFGSATAGTTTYGTQFGTYTRIGNVCFVFIRVSWTAVTGTGNGQVGNLPFASLNPSHATMAVMSANIGYTNAGLRAFIGNGIQFLQLFDQVVGAFGASAIDAAGELIITGAYLIA